MSENETQECRDLLPVEKDLPIPYVNAETDEEEIKVYEVKSKNSVTLFLNLWKYLTMTVAFAAIFICIISFLYFDGETSEDQPSDSDDESESTYADTEVVAVPDTSLNSTLTVMNEAIPVFDLNDYIDNGGGESSFIKGNGEISIILVHSHSTEYISENISVLEAGDAISQLLNSAGIKTIHCNEPFDAAGKIGAYERMKTKVQELSSDLEGVVWIIDLHSADSGADISFTVGVSPSFGWSENLRCAVTVAEYLDKTEAVLRLLPSALGQDSGNITLNIGIGGNDRDDEIGRGIIAALVNAILDMYNENPRVAPEDSFKY